MDRSCAARFPSGRPSISREATGLFSALEVESRGDPSPLQEWHRVGYPALAGSLRRAGFDASFADEAAAFVLGQALRTFRAGRAVRNERAWMATVAAHLAADEARVRTRPDLPPEK